MKPACSPGARPLTYLREKTPEPFRPEPSGRSGYSIHHKFVVCDFNVPRPLAYGGSSNLAGGGETKNGDRRSTSMVRFLHHQPVAVSAMRMGQSDIATGREPGARARWGTPSPCRRPSPFSSPGPRDITKPGG